MADTVPGEANVAVALVFSPRLPAILEPLNGIAPPQLDQRPDDPGIRHRIYSSQSPRAGAAQKAMQNSLRLIVGGVPHGNAVRFPRLDQRAKKTVPEFPSLRFQIGPSFRRQAANVGSSTIEGESQLIGQRADETFVFLRLIAPQPMIKVAHRKYATQFRREFLQRQQKSR
jgi:hypothetical protein